VTAQLTAGDARAVLRAAAAAEAAQPLVVLVGGPPASGKSAVADALGTLAGLVTLHKDAFKEALMTELGVASVAEAAALSGGAVVSLFAAGEAVTARGLDVILDSTFSARDVERIRALRHPGGYALLQVHVTATADVLMQRWHARAGRRHPGHLDAERADEVRVRIDAHTWDALRLDAPFLSIDTSANDPFDAEMWLDAVRRATDAAATR
jgi:predicted kinase